MVFKLNISDKGKAWKVESSNEAIIGKKIGDTIDGSELSEELTGYTLKITGGTDSSGFPHKADLQGPEMKKVILTKGWGMHKKPRRGGKKKTGTPEGLRLRKTVRGNQISEKSAQINMIVIKEGTKKLTELFPEQNKPKEKPVTEQPVESPAQAESPKEEIKEEITKEIKEEIKEDIPKSPETDSPKKKERAAEKIAEEVAEEVEEAIEKTVSKDSKE